MSTSRQSISAVNSARSPRLRKERRFRFFLLLALLCLALILPTVASADGWMSYGQTVTGYIARNDYQDSWRFSATAGDTIAIQLQRTSGCVDAHFSVFNPSGSILGFNWEYLGQFRGCSVRDTFRVRGLKLNRSGTYTVRVSRFGGPSAGGEGGYRLTLTLQQAACKRLGAKLRPGVRAKNALSGVINIRAQASTSGRKITELGSGAVVDVLDGPVNANGYYWFKIRHGDTTGWAAESGNCKYWLQQTNDTVSKDKQVKPGEAIVVDGRCTLNDAITAANTDRQSGNCPGGNGNDSIRLNTNVTLRSKLPSIESVVKIEGNNRTISGDNRYRIFEIAANGRLTILYLTLRHGKTDRNGGAILNSGTLYVRSSELKNSHANQHGGAIFSSGDLTIRNSAFGNNTAGGSGGAIRNRGTLRVYGSSRFTSNIAEDRGGAIRDDGNTIILSDNTRFSNNSPQNCVGLDCGDVPALDPSLPYIDFDFSLTKTLPEGDEFHRIQLRLTDPGNVISVRMTALSRGMVPGLTLWGSGNELVTDSNEGGGNVAELEQVELDAGLYEISAWTVRGGGRYKLQVYNGGLPAISIPPLDPDLPTLHINSTTKPYSLAAGDAFERFQLRLTEPHTLSFRITAFDPGMFPAMTIWSDANESHKDINDRGAYYAVLENIKLDAGYYHVVAWTNGGPGGDYVVEVYDGALPAPLDPPEPQATATFT
ncbi:MAG: SH3 domain-containing protein, partial [Chloroflexi bacterium]|nr:SH3 domain-containing protein [Chloroflexota bacterium]